MENLEEHAVRIWVFYFVISGLYGLESLTILRCVCMCVLSFCVCFYNNRSLVLLKVNVVCGVNSGPINT